MNYQRSISLNLLGLLLAWLTATPVAALQCTAPPADWQLDQRLPHTARRLATEQPLVIIAIGSSSTAGFGASSPAHSYPADLQTYLRARFPGHLIRVLNRGVGGQTVVQMLARFDRDVLPLTPDLVIWQIGTNAVLRHLALLAFRQSLQAGIARIHASGADLVLMNAQYAPKVLAQADYSEFQRLLDRLAQRQHIPVFDRFVLMHDWFTHGARFRDMLAPDRLHMNDAGYDCIARLLARAIVTATRAPLQPAAVAAMSATRPPTSRAIR